MYNLIVTHQALSGMVERTEAQSPDVDWLLRFCVPMWREHPGTLMIRIEGEGFVLVPPGQE